MYLILVSMVLIMSCIDLLLQSRKRKFSIRNMGKCFLPFLHNALAYKGVQLLICVKNLWKDLMMYKCVHEVCIM